MKSHQPGLRVARTSLFINAHVTYQGETQGPGDCQTGYTLQRTWLATDPLLKQEVLLFVPKKAQTKAQLRQAWVDHAQSISRLKHPKLAEVLEVGEHDGWTFMSCMRGKTQTLAERLATGTAPTPVEAAIWMADVIDGLAYVHEAGKAHYDLGLHNILIDGAGRASLAGIGTDARFTSPFIHFPKYFSASTFASAGLISPVTTK